MIHGSIVALITPFRDGQLMKQHCVIWLTGTLSKAPMGLYL